MGNYDYDYTKIKTGDYNYDYTKFGKADYDYNNHCNRLQMITITIVISPMPVAEQCLTHLGVREATDLIGLVSVSGGGGGSHRLALCQGPRSCRARNRETQSKDP